jgi:ABC-2 type transport system permease protein
MRLGLLHRFAYRLEVATSLVSSLMVMVLNASIWNAAVEGRPELGGLTRLQLSTYVIVAWGVTTVSSTRLDENLGMRFRTGHIASDLTRPLDLQLFFVARELGRALATLVLVGAPIVVVAATLYPLAWPAHWWTWPSFFGSIALGVVIGAQVAFLVGIASFPLKNVTGLSHLKATLTALLSGAVIPLDALPQWLRPFVMALPFQAMSHVPASLFLERVPWQALWRPLGVQVAWAAGLFLVCRFAWSRAIDHLTVQGG